MFLQPTTHPKITLLRILIPLSTLLVICSLADGGGICFRKYNSEKGACKGRMSREFIASEPNSCCGKHGQGHALELKRLGKSKKWFECVPCPPKQQPSDPVAMSQVASQELQVDDPSSVKEQGIGGGGKEDFWTQKRRNKGGGGGKSENKMIAFNQGKNQAKEFSIEDNSFKSPETHDEKAQVKVKEVSDDVWSPWSDWGPCSQTCGDGRHQRTRFCLQANCKEEDFQERPCDNLKPCVVDGQWSVYSEWSTCNVTCGEGYEDRSRTCSEPAPANGGKDCQGPRTETRKCQKELPCPVDGGWSDWTNWTTCSATCGEGFQTRSRQCNSPLPQHGGKPCEGIELESMPCVTRTNCAVDGNWTEWSKMDICSAKPCSGQPGYRTRFRSCTSPRPMFGGRPCKGRSWMREPCYNNDFCTDKVDGGWCTWKDWSECKKGIMKRIRGCECPPPANDGKHCEGDDFEEKTCGIILERQEEMAATVKTAAYVTKREGCYDNEASGDGSDVNCDQEPEEPATTEETGSGQQ